MKKRKAVILFMIIVKGVLLLLLLRNGWMDVRALSVSSSEVYAEAELKKIALTFDDGPHPFYTEQLLDGLKERGGV